MSEWTIGTPFEPGLHLCSAQLVSLSSGGDGECPLVAVAFGNTVTVLPLECSPSDKSQFCTVVPGESETKERATTGERDPSHFLQLRTQAQTSSVLEKACGLAFTREHEKDSEMRAVEPEASKFASPSSAVLPQSVSGNIRQLEWSPSIVLKGREGTPPCSLLAAVTCEGNLVLHAPGTLGGENEYHAVYNFRESEKTFGGQFKADRTASSSASSSKKKQKLSNGAAGNGGMNLNTFHVVHCAFSLSSLDEQTSSSLFFAVSGYSTADGSNSRLLCALTNHGEGEEGGRRVPLLGCELTAKLEDPATLCQLLKFVEKENGDKEKGKYFLACCYEDCTVTICSVALAAAGKGLKAGPVLLQVKLPLQGIATCFTASFDADLRLGIAIGMAEGSVAVYQAGALADDSDSEAAGAAEKEGKFTVHQAHNECVSGICIISGTMSMGKDNMFLHNQHSSGLGKEKRASVKHPLMRMGLCCNSEGTKVASIATMASRRIKNPSTLNKRRNKMCTLDVCTLEVVDEIRTICTCSQDGQIQFSHF